MTNNRALRWWTIGLVGALLAGCLAPTAVPTLDLAGRVAATLTAAPPPQVGGPPGPSPVVAASPAAPEAVRRPAHTATPLPDPIRFTFPTQAAEPISLWRAPLYPIPWEPGPNDHFYFIRPIGANSVNWPLARYRYGYQLYAEPHTGIDVPAPKGTPVMAAGPGTVVWAGYGLYYMRNQENDPYGIAVAIRHDFGYNGQALFTIYGHLDQTYVYRGQRLEGGEPVGVVGETGKVSGPHLHFEVRLGEETFFESRNPELWISPPEGTGVLVGRIMNDKGEPATQVPVKLFAKQGSATYDVLTYAAGSVNSDDYYRENLVLSDLPAGDYMLWMDYLSITFRTDLTIHPGQITYLTFRQRDGFQYALPPAPGPTFMPPDATPTGTLVSPGTAP